MVVRHKSLLFLLLCGLWSVVCSPSFAQVSEQDLLNQIAPVAGEPQNPDNQQEAKGDLDEPFRVAADAEVTMNYVFAESPDSFILKYKMHLEGKVRSKVDVIKGKGQVTTEVKGFLAKWPTGECQLKVGVGEFPFEIIFNKSGEEQVHLDVKITEPILENWESNCKFTDAPGSKFNTKGSAEKWFDQSMKKTTPTLKDLQLPIDRLHKDTTTLKFNIERYLQPDPPLGSVEMEGKGTVQIIPE